MENTYTLTLSEQEANTMVKMYDILVEDVNWQDARRWKHADTINAMGEIIMKVFYMQEARRIAQK